MAAQLRSRVGDGATSLAFALMVAASQAGSWCAAVGLTDPGPVAAAGLGVCLERLALITAAGDQWPAVTAARLSVAAPASTLALMDMDRSFPERVLRSSRSWRTSLSNMLG